MLKKSFSKIITIDYPNGNKQYEANFKNDMENRLVVQHDESGVKIIEVQFINDKQV